ncbi:hypothetical protein Tco_0869583 [Tanacetum coccineum]
MSFDMPASPKYLSSLACASLAEGDLNELIIKYKIPRDLHPRLPSKDFVLSKLPDDAIDRVDGDVVSSLHNECYVEEIFAIEPNGDCCFQAYSELFATPRGHWFFLLCIKASTLRWFAFD